MYWNLIGKIPKFITFEVNLTPFGAESDIPTLGVPSARSSNSWRRSTWQPTGHSSRSSCMAESRARPTGGKASSETADSIRTFGSIPKWCEIRPKYLTRGGFQHGGQLIWRICSELHQRRLRVLPEGRSHLLNHLAGGEILTLRKIAIWMSKNCQKIDI